MSAHSQNTVHDLVLGTAVASETTLQAFKDTASAGEVGIFSKNGTTVTEGGPFVVAQKLANTTFISDVVYPDKTTAEKVTADSAEVQKEVTVGGVTSFPTVPTAGEKYEYLVFNRVFNHGSLSVEDYHHYIGQYVATNGETVADIVDGLVTNLNQNLSKEPGATSSTNPLFTFETGTTSQTITVDTAPDTDNTAVVTINGTAINVSLLGADDADGAATKIAAAIDGTAGFTATSSSNVVTYSSDDNIDVNATFDDGGTNTVVTIADVASAAILVITAKEQDLVLGLKEGRQIEFEVTVKVSKVGDEDFAVDQPDVVTTVASDPGQGTGKAIALAEYFFRGNRGDAYRGVGYPYVWSKDSKTTADPTAGYNLFTFKHYYDKNDFNKIQMPKQVTVAITESGSTGIDDIIGDYNTLTGKSISVLGE